MMTNNLDTTQTIITKDNGARKLQYEQERLERYIDSIVEDFPQLEEYIDDYKAKIHRFVSSKAEISADLILERLIENAVENVDVDQPEWQYFAARLYINRLYREAGKNRFFDPKKKYGSFYALQEGLLEKGVYSSTILDKYTREELAKAEKIIDPEKDKLFTYLGLRTLAERYLGRAGNGDLYELPQERWLTIALYLMQDEKPSKRMGHVKEAYWALSNLYMTVATPTLANSGKSHGQLSSCFIDTMDDSLTSIYDTVNSVAQVSKYGGGIGIYMGLIRSAGAAIRGVKNASGGVMIWLRQLEACTSVNQLGVRKAGIAPYLPVWHPDIEAFLDIRLNNGDENLRAHNLNPGVVIPDLFMEQVEKDGDWHLFCPYETRVRKGWHLDDFYDEELGRGTFRSRYQELVDDSDMPRRIVKAKDIFKRMLRSQAESGFPYHFYKDTANRDNPMKNHGIIYSSQLCTEIMQNMSPTKFTETVIEGDKVIIEKTAGDFVVCNLSSISLAKAYNDKVLDRLIPIQVRMLDNVIDVNILPVPMAKITNKKYRAIGLGTSGFHQLLATNKLHWESEEAVEFTSKVHEEIAYRTIKASADLAKEKGYPEKFEGSEWQTGAYFERNGYLDHDSEWDWKGLNEQIKSTGLRNQNLQCTAPTSTTASISASTPSCDGVTDIFYTEEKKDMKIPVVVPDYSIETNNYYKPAYQTDQSWSIKHNAVRQKWIDQATSFNLYINNDGTQQGAEAGTREEKKAVRLYNHHFQIWRSGIKTSYYIKGQTIQAEECVWCSS